MDSTLGEGSVFRIYLPIGNVQLRKRNWNMKKVVKSYSDHKNMLMDEIALLNDAMEKMSRKLRKIRQECLACCLWKMMKRCWKCW